MNILSKFSNISTFILDVDGVLTDGNILVLATGDMARSMNTKDGYVLQLAIKKGYRIIVITGAAPNAVETRLKNLGIHEIYFGVSDKRALVEEIIAKDRLNKETILFMGDDIPDLEAFDIVGLGCCPADAVADVLHVSDYISPLNGGRGCVRDVMEKVLKLRGDWGVKENIASK